MAARPPMSTTGRRWLWAAATLAVVAATPNAQDSAWRADPEVAKRLARITPAQVQETVAALVACGTRHSASESESGNRGIGAARRWLVEKLRAISAARGGRLQVEEEWTDLVSATRLPGGKARGANVIARLVGTVEPDRIVVVSGHYDSINSKYDLRRGGIDPAGDAPGADDDASGTAVAVACAEALADLQFPMTIEFCAMTAEEQGLLGSEAHAKKLKESGKFVELAITNDIVGASRGEDGIVRNQFVRLFSPCPAGLDSPARNLARHAVDVAKLYSPGFEPVLVFRADRYGRGGDHTSFEKFGFPGIRFTEPREDYRHQHQDVREEGGVRYGDLPEHLDFEYLARVARLNAALVAEVASAPPAPSDVRVNGALRHDTTVSWKAPAAVWASQLAGFEVVARPTTAATWEKQFPGGSEVSVVVPVVLDDAVVGVRAVSKTGRRSAASVPVERGASESRPAR